MSLISNDNYKVAIIGTGKTGHLLLDVVPKECIIGPFNSTFKVEDNLEELKKADVAIIFTLANHADSYIPSLIETRIPVIWGVTNYSFSNNLKQEIIDNSCIWLQSDNFAFGMMTLLPLLSKFINFQEWGDDIEFVIEETHHKNKIDSPSGTAKLWKGLLENSGLKKEIKIISHRLADALGEHSLKIKMQNEEITINHKTLDRRVYAQGAYWVAMRLLKNMPAVGAGVHQLLSIWNKLIR